MAGMALRENDIGYARFLLGKVQAVAHILEMGKYNGIRQYQEASFMASGVSFILHCIMEKVLVEQRLE